MGRFVRRSYKRMAAANDYRERISEKFYPASSDLVGRCKARIVSEWFSGRSLRTCGVS